MGVATIEGRFQSIQDEEVVLLLLDRMCPTPPVNGVKLQ
jgi:hypothetical protein